MQTTCFFANDEVICYMWFCCMTATVAAELDTAGLRLAKF